MSPDKKGIFVSGATGTRYSSRALHDAMVDASYIDPVFIPSALMSSDPPKDSELRDLLKANSGQPVDIFIHSSGGAQLMRAFRQAGRIDTRKMTIVAIDIPRGPRHLVHNLRIINGEATRAIDSVTAFHPDSKVMSLSTATEALRLAFSDLAYQSWGLPVIDYQKCQPVNYSSSLIQDQKRRVKELDEEIDVALPEEDLPVVRDRFVERGSFLHSDKELIYHGDSSFIREPIEAQGEIKREESLRTHLASVRILPAVASGSAWRDLRRLEQRYRDGLGPRVVFAIPEWGQFVSPADADAIQSFPHMETGNIVFLAGLSHSGFVLQPQVIGEIKRHIDKTAPPSNLSML